MAKIFPIVFCVFGHFGRLFLDLKHCVDCLPVSFGILWYSFKQRSESSARCYFWSIVRERGTHREQSFLYIQMFMQNVFNIFKISAISRAFTFRSCKTMKWIFFTFSGIMTSSGRPERSSSSMFVQPHLNSLNHSQI